MSHTPNHDHHDHHEHDEDRQDHTGEPVSATGEHDERADDAQDATTTRPVAVVHGYLIHDPIAEILNQPIDKYEFRRRDEDTADDADEL